MPSQKNKHYKNPTTQQAWYLSIDMHTCSLLYIGQTSRNRKPRYHEHIRNNNPQSAYAQHILNNRHEIGALDKITLIKPLYTQHLVTTNEQFYIHSFHSNSKLISEQSPSSPNSLFDLTTHPSHPRANRASCAMNSSVLTHRTTPTYNIETTTHNTPHNNHTQPAHTRSTTNLTNTEHIDPHR